MSHPSLEAGVPAAPELPGFPVVSPERVVETGGLVLDLRSPAEFAEDHLPGALNVPLFDDAERHVIGWLYARRSPAEAFEEGARVTYTKVDALVARIASLAGWESTEEDLGARVERMIAGGIARLEGQLAPRAVETTPADAVFLSCWRGGLRSASVVALLRQLGFERAFGVAGGYRAYRTLVRERIASWQAPPTFVLRGLTGVGKTLILRELELLRPGWTLDLEGLAGHRSSILGMVGLEPVSQKAFESRLAARLEAGFPGPCIVEGESRKVGDVILPPSVWAALSGGVSLELTARGERRVDVLVEDYLEREENRAELAQKLPFIEERLGREWDGKLVGLLKEGRERELVAILLERYYDPLYRHSERKHSYATSIDAVDPRAAAAAVVRFVEDLTGG